MAEWSYYVCLDQYLYCLKQTLIDLKHEIKKYDK